MANSSAAAPSHAPVSMESLLASYASSPDPTLAALEHIVSERNTFAGHNSQMWKLIEKQRTAYAQVLKELERVRGERDVLKSRLQSAG
ncbi:hypothetical protein CONPUDRAFT_30436, partial [Coniophora puteana RWD-64-598 SS2]